VHAKELLDMIQNHQMYALQLRPAVLDSSNSNVSEPLTSHSVIHADKRKSFPSALNTTFYWPGVKTVIHWGGGRMILPQSSGLKH
jgi:hypothetical protein